MATEMLNLLAQHHRQVSEIDGQNDAIGVSDWKRQETSR